MSVNSAELALCAARTRILAEPLNDAERDQLIEEWAEMVDDLESPGTNSELTLLSFRASVERRLNTRSATSKPPLIPSPTQPLSGD